MELVPRPPDSCYLHHLQMQRVYNYVNDEVKSVESKWSSVLRRRRKYSGLIYCEKDLAPILSTLRDGVK